MAQGELTSPLAPTAVPPERVGNVWEAKMAPNAPGGRGPLRFEAGAATDTDVPNNFMLGVHQGYQTGARPNQNANVFEKWPQETTAERAHMGAAAWTESLDYKSAFAAGAGPEAEVRFVEAVNDGGHQMRVSPARVVD